jgi:hypothetical protein
MGGAPRAAARVLSSSPAQLVESLASPGQHAALLLSAPDSSLTAALLPRALFGREAQGEFAVALSLTRADRAVAAALRGGVEGACALRFLAAAEQLREAADAAELCDETGAVFVGSVPLGPAESAAQEYISLPGELHCSRQHCRRSPSRSPPLRADSPTDTARVLAALREALVMAAHAQTEAGRDNSTAEQIRARSRLRRPETDPELFSLLQTRAEVRCARARTRTRVAAMLTLQRRAVSRGLFGRHQRHCRARHAAEYAASRRVARWPALTRMCAR